MHLNVVKHFHQNIDSVKDRAKFDTMNMYEDKKIHVWNQNNNKSENYFKSSHTLQRKLIVEAQECDRLHFSTYPPPPPQKKKEEKMVVYLISDIQGRCKK